MKKILLLATIILNLSCGNRTVEVRYYPTDHEFSHQNPEVIELETTKAGIPSVNWNMLKTDEYELQLECDTGKEILKFVIETKKSAS